MVRCTVSLFRLTSPKMIKGSAYGHLISFYLFLAFILNFYFLFRHLSKCLLKEK